MRFRRAGWRRCQVRVRGAGAGAGAEVVEEVGEASFGGGGVELGEAGDAGADDEVEVGLGSGPEGAEEAVGQSRGTGTVRTSVVPGRSQRRSIGMARWSSAAAYSGK